MVTKRTSKAVGARKTAGKTKPEPPWEQENPKGDHHKHLSKQAKATAKQRAKKAGRPYPNLVDNMQAAKQEKK